MQTPTPPTSAGAQPAPDDKSGEHDVLKKLRAISLTFAGVVALFSYFFHIDYFPLFDLQAAASYLFAVVWVLGVLLILFATTLLLPYAIFGFVFKTRKTARGQRKLADAIYAWTFFGMLSLVGMSGSVLLYSWLGWNVLWSLFMALAFSLFLWAFRARLVVKTIKKKHGSHIVDLGAEKTIRNLMLKQLGIAMTCALLQLFPLMMLLSMFSRASGIADDDYLAFFSVSMQCALFIAVIGGIVLHVSFVPRFGKYRWVAPLLILALPLVLNTLSGATGMLPMTMAQLTKIGNIRAEKLVLSPKACVSIAPILGLDCDEKTSPPIKLCNVHIMSRIGPETYLRIADRNVGSDGKYPIHRILLPTTDITSMQLNFKVKILRLDLIDEDLGGRSSACDTTLTTLHGDSAFNFDDFTLTDVGKTQLLSFIQEIKNGAPAIAEVKVTGHADLIGRTTRNAWLSERRAQEVKLFMEKHLKNQAPAMNINATSAGSTQPLMKDCGALAALKERIKCEAPNRRVELEIIKKTKPS